MSPPLTVTSSSHSSCISRPTLIKASALLFAVTFLFLHFVVFRGDDDVVKTAKEVHDTPPAPPPPTTVPLEIPDNLTTIQSSGVTPFPLPTTTKHLLNNPKLFRSTLQEVPPTCFTDGVHRKFYVGNTWMLRRWICVNAGERRVSETMINIFKDGCKKSNNNNIMLDVGSNTGILGLLGMYHGCRTIFIDMQPKCNEYVAYGLVGNPGFAERGMVLNVAIADTQPNSVRIPINSGCDGNLKLGIANTSAAKTFHTVPMRRLTDVLPPYPILLMKIDTEGYESKVLQGSIDMFSQRLIENAIVEVTPCCKFWEHAKVTREEVANVFKKIASFGYDMVPLWEKQKMRLTTPEEIFTFIFKEEFEQVDMWLIKRA
eukprot:PhF_6_TR13187/c0_g1_i1/m.20818